MARVEMFGFTAARAEDERLRTFASPRALYDANIVGAPVFRSAVSPLRPNLFARPWYNLGCAGCAARRYG